MAVSEQDVIDVMDTHLSVADVAPYLATAENFFSDQLSGEGVSSTMQDEITKYLAAHFASIKDRRAQQVQVGRERETYADFGRGLEATDYGQTAIALDPTGILARLSGGSLRWRSGGR